MIDRDNVEKVCKEYGFQIYCKLGNGHLIYMNDDGINLEISLTDNSFVLKAIVDCLFVLSSGGAGPFYEEVPVYRQFEKMYKRFADDLSKLKRVL